MFKLAIDSFFLIDHYISLAQNHFVQSFQYPLRLMLVLMIALKSPGNFAAEKNLTFIYATREKLFVNEKTKTFWKVITFYYE